MAPLLTVNSLSVWLPEEGREPVRVLSDLSLALQAGEMTALVGESGSGKTTLGLALLRLLPEGARISGRVLLNERNDGGNGGRNGGEAGGAEDFSPVDLLVLSEGEMRRRRGAAVAMMFQEPGAALDPRLRAGAQVAGCLRIHRRISHREARREAVALLARVGMPEPERRARDYPHQLSGGMRQRVALAMALANRPRVLIADEPTTALDLRLQQQNLQVLREQVDHDGLALLLITHDLRLAGQWCDRIAVLYAGRLVESGPRAQVLRSPRHPYTRALLAVSPSLEQPTDRLPALPGGAAAAREFLSACAFAPRCAGRVEACTRQLPDWSECAGGGGVRCLRWQELAGEAAAGGRP